MISTFSGAGVSPSHCPPETTSVEQDIQFSMSGVQYHCSSDSVHLYLSRGREKGGGVVGRWGRGREGEMVVTVWNNQWEEEGKEGGIYVGDKFPISIHCIAVCSGWSHVYVQVSTYMYACNSFPPQPFSECTCTCTCMRIMEENTHGS